MANYNSLFTGAEIDAAVEAANNPDTAPESGSDALITSGAVHAATALVLVDKTASFNFTATEAGKLVNASSSSAIVGTIQPDSVLDLPIGTVLMMRRVLVALAAAVPVRKALEMLPLEQLIQALAEAVAQGCPRARLAMAALAALEF